MAYDQSVVEKIKKLLALADGDQNQNEHEREVAMKFAMDLLAKHNLTVAELSGAALAGAAVEEVQGEFTLEKWTENVLATACTLYYTTYYTTWRWNGWRGTHRKVPVFVGTSDNVAVTIAVATWLIESVRRESNHVYKTAYERRSFRSGASVRLYDRALDLVLAETKSEDSGTGTSLVVIRNQLEAANEAHMEKLNLRTVRRRASYVDLDAFASGEAFGDQVNLTRQGKGATVRPARIPVFNNR